MIQSFIDMLTSLGLVLLYFVPLLLWSCEWFFVRNTKYISGYVLAVSAFPLTVLMIVLIPAAEWTFVFYYILFLISFYFIRYRGQSQADAFILSVYLSYSICVLWEWPIQASIQFDNEDIFFFAQILSVFKALAIPLFLLKCKRLGYKFSRHNGLWVIIIMLLGLNLFCLLELAGGVVGHLFWFAHFYRVPWILLMLSFVPKQLNISTKSIQTDQVVI